LYDTITDWSNGTYIKKGYTVLYTIISSNLCENEEKGSDGMTELLQQAFERAKQLPTEVQNALAALILEEIEEWA
jgi:hypothetical protein